MPLKTPHHSWAWLSNVVLKGGLLWVTGELCRARIYVGNAYETRALTQLMYALPIGAFAVSSFMQVPTW